jgi:LysM repeat protein
MKHLLKNFAATKGRFRFRADVGTEDGLTGTTKEGTGGVKLMTVFIAVLGLHVLVIGGITIYHVIKGPSKDATPSEPNAVAEATSPDGTTDKATTPDASGTPSVTDASATPAPNETADSAAPGSTPSVQTNDGSAPVANSTVAQAPTAVSTVAQAPLARVPVTMPAAVPTIPASAPVAVPAMSGGVPYVVKSGDTLHKIAASHGMTVAKLKEVNGLKGDMLRIGQKLTVGAATSVAMAPAPAPAMAVAPASAVVPASAPIAQAPAPAVAAPGHSYTVVKGDTLTKIAKSFGISPAAIMAANRLSDPKKLKIGQALLIPGKADRREVSQQKVVPTTIQPQANPDLVMNK